MALLPYSFSRKPLCPPSFFCPRTLQHVHGCLLRQPSSGKKPPRATDSTVDVAHTAARASGTTPQPGARGFTVEAEGYAFPTPPRDSRLPDQRFSATDGEKEPASSERDRRFPDPAGNPRPTRVSLQGVFSPKVRMIEGTIIVCPQNVGTVPISAAEGLFLLLVVSMLSTSWSVTLKCAATMLTSAYDRARVARKTLRARSINTSSGRPPCILVPGTSKTPQRTESQTCHFSSGKLWASRGRGQ